MSDLPWTDQGLLLLQVINEIIIDNGGRKKFSELIIKRERQYRESLSSRPKRPQMDLILPQITDLFQHHTIVEMAKMLKVSDTTIARACKTLGLKDDKIRRSLIRNAHKKRAVIIAFNGEKIRKESIAEAARFLHVDKSYLGSRIHQSKPVRKHEVRFA